MQQIALQKVNQLVTFLSKTSGRDKSLRLLQYFCLFMADRKISQNIIPSLLAGKKWLRFSNQMRTVRKVLRFLRTIEYSRKVVEGVRKIRDGKFKSEGELVIIALSVLSALCTVLFFATDHRVFLAEIGVISKDNLGTNLHKSFRYWMWECIFSLIRDLVEIYDLKNKPVSSLEIADNRARLRELKLDAVKNLLDAFIGYSRIRPALSPAGIGFIGTITSIIGIYQLWE